MSAPRVPMAFREAGSGPPVVLLHGLADHGGVWDAAMAHLAGRHRCLAPDLRGHGESAAAEAHAYDAGAFASDLEAWARDTRVADATVVAHSWAAKVALVWARRAPGRIRRLALVDPFFVNRLPGLFRPTLPILYRTLPFLRAMGPFPSYEEAETAVRTLKQYRGWSEGQEAVFRAGMRQAPDGTWRSRFTVEARDGVFDDMLRTDGLTEPLDTPTWVLLPEGGLNRTRWQLAVYRRHLSNCTFRRIPGNHWPHLVEPDAFHEALDDLLG